MSRRAFLSKVIEDIQQQLRLREQRQMDIAAEILGVSRVGAAEALGRLKALPRDVLRWHALWHLGKAVAICCSWMASRV